MKGSVIMAVDEVNKVDGMGKESDQLVLLIADYLDWDAEYDHLVILQDKINAYLSFIESKQYQDTYPDEEFSQFWIDIHFKHDITQNCEYFLESIASQIEPLNIKIRAEIVEKE